MDKKIETVERLDWLDVLKCVAMYLVLLGHVSRGRTPDTLRFYIYAFHMPLFFIISGMGFYLQTKKRDYEFVDMLKNKARTLLWPYLIFNIMLIPLWIYNWKIIAFKKESITQLIMAIFYSNQNWHSMPTSTTWFITCLFLSMMLFFLIWKWAGKDERLITIMCLIMGVLGYAMSLSSKNHFAYPWHINTVPMACMLLMLGYVFIKNIDLVNKILGTKWYQHLIWIVVLLGAGFCCARFNVKVSMGVNSYGSFILFLGAVVCFSLICYIVSTWIPAFGFFKLVGRNAIIYLALHEQIYRIFSHYNSTTHAMITGHPFLVATFVFIAIAPIAWLIEKYAPILIGKRKRKYV